jgi:hypothetical protein
VCVCVDCRSPLGATPCCCHHTFRAAGTGGYKQTTVTQHLIAPIRRPKMADHQITDGLTNKRRLAAEGKKPVVGSQCSRSERTILGLANCDDATRIRPRLPGRTRFVRRRVPLRRWQDIQLDALNQLGTKTDRRTYPCKSRIVTDNLCDLVRLPNSSCASGPFGETASPDEKIGSQRGGEICPASCSALTSTAAPHWSDTKAGFQWPSKSYFPLL